MLSEGTKFSLSICMATLNRSKYIGQTLDSLLGQMTSDVEVVVVDGASTDNTAEVMESYTSRYPQISYYRESINSGVDADFDKAVGYAKGEYCWLMTDDDLLREGAVLKVLGALKSKPEVVVVNSELRTADLKTVIKERCVSAEADREYCSNDMQKCLAELGGYLSFIGAVVVKRDLWMARDRRTFYGTLFVHVGVIFQHPPLSKVKLIADPQIVIRYGNAMWTPRGFEIWMFKWPELVWSFTDFTDQAKSAVCMEKPWSSIKKIAWYRALGGYGKPEYEKYMASKVTGGYRQICLLLAILPVGLLNFLATFYCTVLNRSAVSELYDLTRSSHSSRISRSLPGLFLRRNK